MTHPARRGHLATLAILGVASVVLSGCGRPAEDPWLIGTEGIGPLQLGRDYAAAVTAARNAAPDTAFAGLGCNGLDEVRYSGMLGQLPVSAMGMADQGRLVEIEVTLDAPVQAPTEAACVALRDEFARPFIDRFGPISQAWEERKPLSREHLASTGPVLLVARWFSTGNSCYVSAHYGYGASLSSTEAAW